ncbi:hypothetical protein COBT_003648, partial [Conglomerata obtusa]
MKNDYNQDDLKEHYEKIVEKLTKYSNELKDKNTLFAKQINEGNAKYGVLYNEKKELIKKIKTLEDKFNDLKNKSDLTSKESIDTLQKKIILKDEQINNLRIELENKDSQINILNEENVRFRKECYNLTNKIKDLHDKIEIKENEIDNIKNENENTRIHNEELENKLNEQFSQIKNLDILIKNKEFTLKNYEEKLFYYELNKNADANKENTLRTKNENIPYYYQKEINKLKANEHKLLERLKMEAKTKQSIFEKFNKLINVITEIEKIIYILKIKNKCNKKRFILLKDNYKHKFSTYKIKYENSNKILNPMKLISERNKKFIQSLIPNQIDLNEVISKFAQIYKSMSNKNDILEKEIKQISYFAENNKTKIKSQTTDLLEAFNKEFKLAKQELEFCKDYLKKKGKEIKLIKKENSNLNQKIVNLENNNIQKNNEETK